MKKLSASGTAARLIRTWGRVVQVGRYGLAKLILVFGVGVGLLFAWPWSTDMVWQPTILPFEGLMRAPPPGTLPVRGGELPLDTQELRNPFPATPESLAKGKQLFRTYCAVCHGQDAKGNGPVGARLLIPAFDLTQRRPEEYIYRRIREGGVVMPSYREALSVEEAWAVVNYVRSLQQE